MSRSTLLSRILPIGVFLVLLVFMAIGLTRDPQLIPSEMIDRQVPEFGLSELHDDATTVTQADLTGSVTLLNVFGSWCAACVVEHPTLMKIAARDDMQIIGVNWRDTRPDATAWLARYGDPYTKIAFDEDSELAIELGVTGAPETFIIDPDGRIRYKHVGPITDDVFAQVIQPVVTLIQSEAET